MKIPTFENLDSYVSQHPAVRPVNEIAVWTWIAGAILIVLALAAVLSPGPGELSSSNPPAPEQLLVPPIGPPALLPPGMIEDPGL